MIPDFNIYGTMGALFVASVLPCLFVLDAGEGLLKRLVSSAASRILGALCPRTVMAYEKTFKMFLAFVIKKSKTLHVRVQ